MYKTFKKLIITANKEDIPSWQLQEILIEQIDEENQRTIEVMRERPATEKEVLAYYSGFGRLLKF